MNSLWDDREAGRYVNDPLQLRVYTSRLLGQEPSLVLHGGGNTSVKTSASNLFGETEQLLYVKGSGWDLASIEARGFAPVRLDVPRRMVELPALTDAEMVQALRAALTDPSAPTPSVEAVLHAIIPFAYVDHTHADAVVAVSNTPGGDQRIREIYGDRTLVVPYVMPGFVLAQKVYEVTRGIDWSCCEGMILLHHGALTFSNDARESYERMLALVSRAEEYLRKRGAWDSVARGSAAEDLRKLAVLRGAVSRVAGKAMVARLDGGPEAAGFSRRPDLSSLASQGPLTPDHVIRTKRVPMILDGEPAEQVENYAGAYRNYFQRHASQGLTCLDPAPRWIVWPGHGTVALGTSCVDAEIVADIARHTQRAIQWAAALGGWRPLPEEDIFAVEYWELEQAKLQPRGAQPSLQGKVALVTGAASGIGFACAQALAAQGAAVVALDIDPGITAQFSGPGFLPRVCDVTDASAVRTAVDAAVRRFGGLDILISNAGSFRRSCTLAEMDAQTWNESLELNLSSHQRLLQDCIPYLAAGVDPTVVIVGSKNVPAPGRGAAAYSVAKAGLTQLARVAALELAAEGIRVNVIHPHGVFDTGLWTEDVLAERAAHQGISVAAYKRANLLGVEVTSKDVAALVCILVGPAFSKTTGAQIPIDGGNERVV